MSAMPALPDPPSPNNSYFHVDDEPRSSSPTSEVASDDAVSQRSISLSSPAASPRHSAAVRHSLSVDPHALSPDDASVASPSAVTPVTLIRQNLSKRESLAQTLDTDLSSEVDDRSLFMQRLDEEADSPISSVAPSMLEKEDKTLSITSSLSAQNLRDSLPPPPPPLVTQAATYPPPPVPVFPKNDRQSVASAASASTTYSKKARPESILLSAPKGPLVLGIALVDFNHLVGPKIEFSRGDIFEDEEIAKILPFLALPDGAHLTTEDYSYFHLVPTSPNPSTIFGISCNRQIKSADLLVKGADVTRSTVQKAIVVLASQPVFGPVRDRLGVITRTFFAQRDFTETTILDDFYNTLENSLRSQLTESGLYMGTSLRDLVHTFRQRTLVLLKALLLQKKIMFYGHPVEKLCTFQYSLVTLVPGLLQNLDDCGSPPLSTRASSITPPTSLRTSDHKSMMAWIGLPLDLFGKDAFFQPYLPLQQLDMLKAAGGWLCGSTNSIVAQQKEVEMLVNIETGAFEFRDPRLERIAALTAADRKWMDDVVRDVNECWDEQEQAWSENSMHFKGSDDYLRQKFEEYITGALASVKYADFLAKGQGSGVTITDMSGDVNSVQDFNMLWIAEFKKTNAHEVWQRVTDPMLFDIVEPRHPCSEKPSVVADIGLRLQEGIQELKLDQQLAPTREAISRTLTAGSTNFFKAVEGVRGRWMSRNPSVSLSDDADASPPIGAATPRSRQGSVQLVASPESMRPRTPPRSQTHSRSNSNTQAPPQLVNGFRPLSLSTSAHKASHPLPSTPPPPEVPKPAVSSWGVGLGSFFSSRASKLAAPRPQSSSSRDVSPALSRTSTASAAGSVVGTGPGGVPVDLGLDELQPRDLDKVYGEGGSVKSLEEPVEGRASGDEHEGEPAGTGFAM